MADRGRDREAIRNIGDSSRREAMQPPAPAPEPPADAGKTSGGGSLGHDQPPGDQSRIRNEGSRGRGDLRDRETPDPLPELEP
ncbi:hypothetical protein D3C83_09620 [compost metagenome]